MKTFDEIYDELQNSDNQELNNAYLLLEALLDVQKFLKGCKNQVCDLETYDLINTKLEKYLKTHYKLWCARNKEPGFVYSSLRIERLKNSLEMLKKEATNYEI